MFREMYSLFPRRLCHRPSMAAALHPASVRSDASPNSVYPRVLMNDYDFADTRYPSISLSPRPWQPIQSANSASSLPSQPPQDRLHPQIFAEQPQDPPRTSLSYALPPGAARRVVERYSLDDIGQPPVSKTPSNETRPTVVDSPQDTPVGRGPPQVARATSPTGRVSPNPPSNLRNSSFAPASPGPSSSPTPQFPPIMPLSASPTYNPPISPNHRASAQQPTYVTQPHAPNPVYTPIAPPQEEICVECAMRDQDMADVDVTSPGVWERASDVLFEELKQRELEEEATGVVVDNPSRPRIKGGRLTEQNVKLWLSINPREPASRQQTLNNYIKSQRTLLEAEALAHARAMQEAKQLDSRMRDTYSQLRRSAYDMGNSSSPADDMGGGVRIKPPLAPNTPNTPLSHARSHSREITLLENGMIVEHVDVRKEEKEARERKKKEEKRARKLSRSSVMDVTSIVSAQSGPIAEGSLKPYSRYSHASSTRPTSVLTAPLDRPNLPRAYSQASFSDVHSLQSASPRRTRFFGMKNLSTGWRSQDSLAPSGMSGSMVDMHVALQRESYGPHPLTSSPIDLNTPRRSQIWPPTDLEEINASQTFPDDKVKKKKGALAKIWRIVTGKNDGSQPPNMPHRQEGQDDDLPLAPPPPLSYLVDRGPTDLQHNGGIRHASTPSLPSVISPKFGSSPGMSPPTAPSSVLPSPSSLRASGVVDVDIVDGQNFNHADDLEQKYAPEEVVAKVQLSTRKSIHSATSEWELRRTPSGPSSPLPASASSNLNVNSVNKPTAISRDKSLPPLPPGEQPARILPSDLRPRTVYSYDPRALPPGTSPAHDFLPPQAPFRTNGDGRRQSFGGTSSRPNLGFQTMPAIKPVDFDSRRSFGPRYDEFGISQRSLGKLEHVKENPPRMSSPLPSTKRKSKFGLSSLLGKKNDKREQEPVQEVVGHPFPSMGYNPYDNQDELTTNGYATSTSRHSAFSSGPFNTSGRMSVTSRKALEELVQQDDDFVAYRYPSNDQRLDLLR
ncbi:hypothetical protein CPB84DRAFT_1704809 [Gymnopilus junonius]|uniref:Proteophosphoglycan ppg4 n=1 Tax=Gymnopilus junonius TaxID=109634 RepID=A0A9P5NW57_GYMJU|nr:hypothetical protein CPB84DRAFT_1704809 [Gymnopilus junonius]